jgi:hypothetical protein
MLRLPLLHVSFQKNLTENKNMGSENSYFSNFASVEQEVKTEKVDLGTSLVRGHCHQANTGET